MFGAQNDGASARAHHSQGATFFDIISSHWSVSGSALNASQAFLSPSSFQRNHGIETCIVCASGVGTCVAPMADHQYASISPIALYALPTQGAATNTSAVPLNINMGDLIMPYSDAQGPSEGCA